MKGLALTIKASGVARDDMLRIFLQTVLEEATVVITRKGNSQDSGGIVQLTTCM